MYNFLRPMFDELFGTYGSRAWNMQLKLNSYRVLTPCLQQVTAQLAFATYTV